MGPIEISDVKAHSINLEKHWRYACVKIEKESSSTNMSLSKAADKILEAYKICGAVFFYRFFSGF